MCAKRTITIQDLEQDHAQTLSEEDLSKIQGGVFRTASPSGAAAKSGKHVDILSFSWGVSQGIGY